MDVSKANTLLNGRLALKIFIDPESLVLVDTCAFRSRERIETTLLERISRPLAFSFAIQMKEI